MCKRYNVVFVLAFLLLMMAMPVQSYAYRSVDDAISWAEDQKGSGAYNDGVYNYCWTFARDTYAGPAISGVGSAIAAWNYNGSILGSRHSDSDIPRGAFVFFAATSSNGGYGHVGLYVGNGKMIHAWPKTVGQSSVNSGGKYLGWRWPVAWTPDSPHDDPDDPDGSLSLDKVQGSKEGKDDWENSFELSMDDIYDMDFRAKLVQEDGAWPSDTEAFFYLSLDKKLDSGDIFLGSKERNLTKENAKKRSIYLEDVDMSDYITSSGTYYVLTKVEFDGGEDKSSSSDSKQRVKLIVSDVPVPDLTLQSLRLNNGSISLNGQELYGMTVNVRNIGEASAKNRFRIKYEISGPDVTDQWRLIADDGFDSVPLAPGNDQIHSTNDSFSAAPVAEGEYRLRACVDYKKTVSESNEGNNCTETTVFVSSAETELKAMHRFWSTKNKAHFYTIDEDEKNLVINKYTDYEWKYEGIAWYSYDTPHDDALPLYRFWSKKNSSHFYTISEEEKEHVEATYTDYEWEYECVESYAYDYQKEGTVPVYRFWSKKNSAHFYTISKAERDAVIEKYTDYEWLYEGVAWYVYPTPTALNPVYRFYSKKNRSHFYTISTSEKNNLILNNAPEAWKYESVGWFAYTYGQGNTLPVYRFWSATNKSHFYTISEEEKDYVIANYSDDEWQYEGTVFYAYKNWEFGTLPVYRFWSKTQNAHFYTASEAEKNDLIANYPDVWQYETEAWFVPQNP
ncbi:MAG: hypothetical protein D3915_06675 [Candidatus Electrothrix sp. AU1_5]|nr:hypothetical protein [Candidatus Electrothrix gigas]